MPTNGVNQAPSAGAARPTRAGHRLRLSGAACRPRPRPSRLTRRGRLVEGVLALGHALDFAEHGSKEHGNGVRAALLNRLAH